MARSSQYVQVGKRRIELSNLDKVLWPGDHVIKAERFFQKNLPEWTPKWIEQTRIGDDEKAIHYLVATEEASMVWLANMAGIELHQMHCRVRERYTPDYFVFDIDPPDGTPWDLIVETGMALREELEKYEYHTFVKTTGRKGLHIVCPLEPRWDFDTVFAATKQIAELTDAGLRYLGRVGTGFDTRTLESVSEEVRGVRKGKRPVSEKPRDEKDTVWIEPLLCCEVQYTSLTRNGTLREPVFLRMRPDLTP